jgi:hypothetical protein
MNDNEKTKKEILSVYEELRGVLVAIEGNNSWFDDHGFADHANEIINRVPKICLEIENIN